MKNVMMILLCFMVLIFMDSVFGMDDKSEKSDSSNEEKFIDLTQYTKQELNRDKLNSNFEMNAYDQKNFINNYEFGNYKSIAECCIKTVSTTFEKTFNELKRKKKPEKTLLCEDCQRESNRYFKGKFSGKYLCQACYKYEFRHGALGPQDERNYNGKHKNQILVCEFCQKESKVFVTGKISGQSLCKVCYNYESRHGQLRSRGERRYVGKHNQVILVCEVCQRESKQFVTGTFSGKSLCGVCYNYESRHGAIAQNERKYNGKHKDQILACEFCQRQNTNYKTGKVSGKSLCNACYLYEFRHGHLIPLDERQINGKHNQILACEFCQRQDTRYKRGKVSGKSLCSSCYQYESRYGQLVPRDERRKKWKHKDQRNDSSNRLFDAENYQNKDRNESTKDSTEQQKNRDEN